MTLVTKKIIIAIAVIAVALIAYGWSTYNRLIIANENIDNQWA